MATSFFPGGTTSPIRSTSFFGSDLSLDKREVGMKREAEDELFWAGGSLKPESFGEGKGKGVQLKGIDRHAKSGGAKKQVINDSD